jgi:hypothetical protein
MKKDRGQVHIIAIVLETHAPHYECSSVLKIHLLEPPCHIGSGFGGRS